MAAVAPKGETLLQTAAWAGSFFASPRTALTAMGQVWEDEHPVAGAEEDQREGSGFWTTVPAQTEEESAPQEASGTTAAEMPQGMLPLPRPA